MYGKNCDKIQVVKVSERLYEIQLFGIQMPEWLRMLRSFPSFALVLQNV